jgi:Cd2+/Zn2+-exporting ATPase
MSAASPLKSKAFPAGVKAGPTAGCCLVNAVSEALVEEPSLEAVKLERGGRNLSVATLGRTDPMVIEEAISERVQRLREHPDANRCGLLEGSSDCRTCPTVISPEVLSRLTVQHGEKTTTIARVTCPTAPKFWRWSVVALPKIVPREVHLPEQEAHEGEWKFQLIAASVCGLCALAAHFFSPAWLALALYAVSYLAGAWFAAMEVWERLQQRQLDVHFLMLAVAAGSASIGAWGEGAMLLFLFSLSGALEHYAMGRTSREIRSLFKSAPKTAIRIDERGQESICPVDELEPGMRLLIKPGEQFPVDGEVVKGSTASDEANLTGEATPVEKRLGDGVLAGTLNLWGAVEVSVTRRASQSALQRIIQLIREAQHLKAPSQRFTDKFGTTYTYLILGMTLGMFFIWWLVFGEPAFVDSAGGRSAFYKAMTLLVVASPCALVLSIPSAVLAAIAWAARRGILFRGGAAVENLAEISVVAMDKTGTLTTGELKVESIESIPPGREAEIASLAYSLEKLSTHPLARAITRYGKQEGVPLVTVEHVESVAGTGLEAVVEGQSVRLGRRDWFQRGLTGVDISAVPSAGAGFAEVWVARPGLAGRILLRDDIRPQARRVVEQLRAAGLRSLVLTGDRKATGEWLQEHLAVDEVRAELKPEHKVEAIRTLTNQHHKVAMIGDGVNDAPSLAAADVGVAMGARGSDAALEQAEVILMHDRLENFLIAYQLSQRARRVIWQNLIISLGTVMVLVACALLGRIPLTLGVLGHEGSTVIVVLNSLRLLLGRIPNAK